MKKGTIEWFFGLAIIGTLISVIALILPWTGVDQGTLSSGGDLAGGVASAFGLAVAAIALRLYVWSESPEKKRIDRLHEQMVVLHTKTMLLHHIETKILMAPGEGYGADAKDRAKKEYIKIMRQLCQTDLTPEMAEYIGANCKDGETVVSQLLISGLLLKDDGSDLLTKPLVYDVNLKIWVADEKVTNVGALYYSCAGKFRTWLALQNAETLRKNTSG